MKKLRHLPYVLVVALLFAATACGGGEQAPATDETATGEQAPGATATSGDLVAEGQQLFAGSAICFTCHGQDATGTQLAPNLTDDEWINIEEPVTVEKIVDLIHTGVAQPKQHPAPMPPMGGAQLDDAQVQAVAVYVYSLTHPNG